MTETSNAKFIEAFLDSWDRNNRILVNLLLALPEGTLDDRATEGGPSIAKMFNHIHFVRLILVNEDVPEFATELPETEWQAESDRNKLARMLNESATVVRNAIKQCLETGRATKIHYDHPMLMIQHLIWHEGYHHGQIKLALKAAGHAMSDEQAGPLTWSIWFQKTQHS
jgi:uncharacterized damage-inducible protein DinB